MGMKNQYPLKVCPWCGKTPVFRMNTELNQTWLPHIECATWDCPVKPKSKPVPIRKDQRGSHAWIFIKILRTVKLWNKGDLKTKGEGFELDLQAIADGFKAGTIGSLVGYRG